MTIGIFGGSFNPPHLGHLVVIEAVRDQLKLDKVIFVPAARNPNKPNSLLTSSQARLEMTELAVKNCRGFEVSDMEIKRKGISYTIDTVMEMSALHPGSPLSLIIGADNLLEFGTWKSPEEIIARAELVVMRRPGFPDEIGKNKYARGGKIVNVPQIGISGTDIRRRVKLGQSIRFLVPERVEEYINFKMLYKT